MCFLIISIIFLAAMAVALRCGIARGADSLELTLVFRIVSGLGVLLAMLFSAFYGSDNNILSSPQIFNWKFLLLTTLAAGFFCGSGLAAIYALRYGPLGPTWTVLRMSMLVPTLASMFFWHEIPIVPKSSTGWLIYTGILTSVLAVIFVWHDRMRLKPGKHESGHLKAWLCWLATAFVCQGLWEICLKTSGTLADDDQRKAFIGLVFLINMALALPLAIARRKNLTPTVIKFGILAGLCSLIASGIRPWALKYIPGHVVFPVTAICVTVLVLMAGIIIWKERLTKYGLIGVAAAIISIVLLTR